MKNIFIDRKNKTIVIDGIEYVFDTEITEQSIERAWNISKVYNKRKQVIICLILQNEALSEVVMRKNAKNINTELLNPVVYLWEGYGGVFMWIGCKNNPNAIISAEFSDEDCSIYNVEIV